jgi:GMP synthase (glutamine-hydrolysing)
MDNQRLLLVQARRPDDPMAGHEQRCFERRLADQAVELRIHNAFRSPPPVALLDETDAILIGGSGDFSVHHAESRHWVEPVQGFVAHAIDRGIPGFGICFGHQLLGELLGSRVVTEEHWAERGTVELSLTDAGRKDPLFGSLPDRFEAQTGHTDVVDSLPQDVELLAENGSVATQAFRVRGTLFYSTQFHPDLTGQEARARYLAYAHKLDHDAAEEARSHAKTYLPGHDGASALLSRFVALVASDTGR